MFFNGCIYQLRNGIFLAISVNKDVTILSFAVLQCELVNPKGTQEGEELPVIFQLQAAATPYGEPQGSSEHEKKNRIPPRIAEIPMKEMISVNPGSCNSPYIEKF